MKVFSDELIAELCPEIEILEETQPEIDYTGKLECKCNYGPFKKGTWYKLIEEFSYYNSMKLRGENISVFKWVFE